MRFLNFRVLLSSGITDRKLELSSSAQFMNDSLRMGGKLFKNHFVLSCPSCFLFIELTPVPSNSDIVKGM